MNDWLDYKGSGSSRAYMGETLAHGRFSSMVRSTADKFVKEVGDVVTIPYDMSKLGKQMTAYANLINAHNDAYNKYISEANKYAKLCNNPLYITSYKSNKAQYDLYKSKAVKAKKDIDKVFKDAQADYEKLGDKIRNNAIIGPIYRMIENIYSNLPAITEIATVSASNQIRR